MTKITKFLYQSNNYSNKLICIPFQTSTVPAAGADFRKVRVGHMHTPRARGGRRGRLLVRVLQRRHRRLLQTGRHQIDEKFIWQINFPRTPFTRACIPADRHILHYLSRHACTQPKLSGAKIALFVVIGRAAIILKNVRLPCARV
jgi:hypothetical protein